MYICYVHNAMSMYIYIMLYIYIYIILYEYIIIIWLVVSTPLQNMSSSIGMMTFPICGQKPVMFQSPPTSYKSIPGFVYPLGRFSSSMG